ncbi:MAG: lipopolysaccharide assembly protein LapA domain-containing protein [Mycobacterium sp.]|uniref:LapA family protein n=1 Tax=Mycobacterium sp. TaxID=1785 RepID=UPI00260CFB8E|nr:lipopolysaccharide assembly protein LapA domain-containing protein [Mycobacterium sp.]MDI3312976.1 lipopolysaccharide assembly protein LapA domain-containing protein [Mycobacterium sp.]
MSSNPPAPSDQPDSTAPPAAEHDAAPSPTVTFTRTGAVWTSLAVGFLILIVLLIFITQNPASAPFTFLGWHWSLPLGVAILLAAVGGGLITVLVGTARIYQLRRAAKKGAAARR